MKAPTIEEIESVTAGWTSRIKAKILAKEIYALIHPPRKPLSELVNDPEACKRVFFELSNLLGHEPSESQLDEWKEELSGRSNSQLPLYHNIFKTVQIIQEAGYEPNPKS